MWKRMLLLASTLAIGAMTGCAARATYYDYGRMSPGPRVRVYGYAPSRGQVWVEVYSAPPAVVAPVVVAPAAPVWVSGYYSCRGGISGRLEF